MRKRKYQPQQQDDVRDASAENDGEAQLCFSGCASTHTIKGVSTNTANASISSAVWSQRNRRRSSREEEEHAMMDSGCANSTSWYLPLEMENISPNKHPPSQTPLLHEVGNQGRYDPAGSSVMSFKSIPLAKVRDASDVHISFLENDRNSPPYTTGKSSDGRIVASPLLPPLIPRGGSHSARLQKDEEEGKTKKRCDFASRPLPLSCVLVPYSVVLIFVALFASLMPYYVTNGSISNSLEDVHGYVQLEVSSQLLSVLNISNMLATVLIGLHIKHETSPSPSDDWVPMGFDMTQRLCSTLLFERMWFIRHVYIASPARDEIALCARGHHEKYFATVQRRPEDGALYRYVAVDPSTVNLVDPLLVIGELRNPFPLKHLIDNLTITGKLLTEWKQWLEEGERRNFRLWNIENFVDRRYMYTRPFLERDGNVAFVKVALDFDEVVRRLFSRLKTAHSKARVVLLNDFAAMKVLATNSNSFARLVVRKCGEVNPFAVSHPTRKRVGGSDNYGSSDSIDDDMCLTPELTLSDLTDPLIVSALKHVDLTDVIAAVSSGEPFFRRFLYGGSKATISFSLVELEVNASAIILIAMPPKAFDRLTVSVGTVAVIVSLTTVFVIIIVYGVIHICVSRPLRLIAAELRVAARVENNLAPARAAATVAAVAVVEAATGRGISRYLRSGESALSGIRMLQRACVSLQDQLTHLRSFLPQGLFHPEHVSRDDLGSQCATIGLTDIERGGEAKSKSDGKTTTMAILARISDIRFGGSMLDERREHINVFTDVVCSVVSVHFSDIKGIIENAEEMASVIVLASAKYGGCIDTFLPELFLISFRSGRRNHIEKLEATQCASEIYRNLSDAARRHCSIIVDSGTFHFGVCGGPEKKELVLWGRYIGSDLVDIQRRHGIPIAVLHSTVPFIRSCMRVLPFASMHMHVPEVASPVTLYALIDDFPDAVAWDSVEETYCNGYSHLVQHAYAEARLCFESLAVSPYATVQLMRCLRAQIAQTKMDVTMELPTPLQLLDQRSHVSSVDCVNTALSMWSPTSICSGEVSTTEEKRELFNPSSPHGMRNGDISCSTTYTWHSAGNKAIPHEFWDTDSVRWSRANGSFPEQRRFPVFLGISDTGTLAALKFLPCSSLEETGYSDSSELEKAWETSRALYHENIVQILGHGMAKGYLCLIMEYVPGGTLRDSVSRYGSPLPLAAIKRFLVSVLRGLEYLHGHGCVHGNVRPECVMVAVEGLYKLRGVTHITSAAASIGALQSRYSFGGSVYCGPEVFATGNRGAAADIYAVGVMLLELITNQTPWQWTDRALARMTTGTGISDEHNTQQQQQQLQCQQAKRLRAELLSVLSDFDQMRSAVHRGDLTLREVPHDCDPLLREVLKGCLASEPADRRTATQLLLLLTNGAPLGREYRND
ncbi:Protein kinase domain [Trypanosoma melophagium]|uniref:Protein kinase domain n=1 Tax=Trypanosoma melophagium TaxID=715481 RepID=UPI00351A14E0|nr:Protein kinase domain [Trypanosoma melophagium]